MKTFIDINIDEYVYASSKDESSLSGKQEFNLLSQKYKDIDNDKLKVQSDSKPNEILKKITDESSRIYFSYRNNITPIGDLLIYLAFYLKINIFFETIGQACNLDYYKSLLSSVSYYNYIPIIIYSYIDDDSIHQDRLISRFKEEGRLPLYSWITSLKTQINEGYNRLKNHIIESNPNKKYSIVKYQNIENNADNYESKNTEFLLSF